MKDNTLAFVWGVLGTILILFICDIGGCNVSKSYDRGYKQGQIDAINGKVKYKLQSNPDSTKTWEKIEVKEDSK